MTGPSTGRSQLLPVASQNPTTGLVSVLILLMHHELFYDLSGHCSINRVLIERSNPQINTLFVRLGELIISLEEVEAHLQILYLPDLSTR